MGNIDEIKKKMKEDGFEYLVEVICYYKELNVFKRHNRQYYLFVKVIGNVMFFKIVDSLQRDYNVEKIESETFTNQGEICQINAKFKDSFGSSYYFKLESF
jgi:hypothetical protein